jgi:hypothetical protein
MTPPPSSKSSAASSEDLSFTILWSPLPPITWLVPFIGHVGIANSRGIASDFQGPYFVGDTGRMAFGPPTRALKIDIGDLPGGAQQWDDAIEEANQVYRGRMHNICCDNCHSHVSNALNRMGVTAYGIKKWDMIKLCFLMFFRARFLSFLGLLSQFGPFLILVLVIVLTTTLTR